MILQLFARKKLGAFNSCKEFRPRAKRCPVPPTAHRSGSQGPRPLAIRGGCASRGTASNIFIIYFFRSAIRWHIAHLKLILSNSYLTQPSNFMFSLINTV